jgi:hypothetical protein
MAVHKVSFEIEGRLPRTPMVVDIPEPLKFSRTPGNIDTLLEKRSPISAKRH